MKMPVSLRIVFPRKVPLAAAAGALLLFAALPAHAFKFSDGDWNGSFDTTVSFGGLYRLEGAWVGAFVYVILNNYLQTIGSIGSRFSTAIGVIFLVVVLVSPSGLMGLWERALGTLRRREPGARGNPPASMTPASADT